MQYAENPTPTPRIIKGLAPPTPSNWPFTVQVGLEKTHRARPGLPTALARAEAGQRIDKRLEEMVEIQEEIDAGPAA